MLKLLAELFRQSFVMKIAARLYDRIALATKALFGTGSTSSSSKGGGRLVGRGAGWQPWSGDPYTQIQEYRSWVYTAVRFRAIKRQTPPMVAIVRPDGEREKSFYERRKGFSVGQWSPPKKWVQKSAHPTAMRASADLEYLPSDHPAVALFHNPNEPQIGFDLWNLCSLFEDLTGRAHVWKVRNGSGRVMELWVLPTPWVQPVPGESRLIDQYKVTMPNGGSEFIDADDIITFSEPSPFGYLSYASPLQAHGLNVDLFNAVVMARFNGMVNGAHVGSMIEIPSSMANNPEMMQRFEASLLARTVGSINYNRPLIAEQGAKIVNLSPQIEVAFANSTKQLRADIFAAFDLDESVMGYANESTYAASVVTDRNVYKKIVKPYQERRNAILTEKLLIPEFGENLVAFNEYKSEETSDEKIKRQDLQARYGAISVNQMRIEWEQEPYEDPIYDEPIIAGRQPSPIGVAESDSGKAPGSRAVESGILNRLMEVSTNGNHA